MTTAQAAVLTAPREIRIEEFDLPATTEDDGLLRVEACGVCASDVPVYRGESNFELPVILGHEIAGRIERIGPRAAQRWGVREDDRVVLERWIPCGKCERCYSGRYRLCVPVVDGHKRFFGGAPTALSPALWGGYAEYVYLPPEAVVYRAPHGVDASHLPLYTPLGNGISWVQKLGGATIGSTVVIQGPGQEGLAAVIAAKAAGAHTIVVTGLTSDQHRLAVAHELGATHTVNVDQADPVELVSDITNGQLADVVLDVTSSRSPEPIETACHLAGVGATIVLPAYHTDHAMRFDSQRFAEKILTLRGAHGRDRESLKAALRLMETGTLPLDRLSTHTFALDETDVALRSIARETDDFSIMHASVVPGPSHGAH